MDLQLTGRSAVVTGGSSGIGTACACALADEGADVVVLDRRAPDGLYAAALAKSGIDVILADVTVEHEVEVGIQAVVQQLGSLDIVIGSAGVSGPVGTPLWNVSEDDWDHVMAVNVKGAYLVAKHTIPVLTQGTDAALVFVGSDSALVAAPGMAPYCASKGALLMLVKALSVDLAPRGVRVTCVCPSIVDTPMSRLDLDARNGFDDEAFPVQTAADVARYVAFLASPRSASINGTHLAADFGFLARSAFPA